MVFYLLPGCSSASTTWFQSASIRNWLDVYPPRSRTERDSVGRRWNVVLAPPVETPALSRTAAICSSDRVVAVTARWNLGVRMFTVALQHCQLLIVQLSTKVIIQILNHKYEVWYYRSGPDGGSVTSHVTRSSVPIKTQTRFLWERLNQPETPSVWSQFDWSLLLRLQRTCRVRCIAQDRRRNNTTAQLTSFFRAAGDEQ